MQKLSDIYIGRVISHSSGKMSDIIPKFYNFLKAHDAAEDLPTLHYGKHKRLGLSKAKYFQSEFALNDCDLLIERLNEIAPEGSYFGVSSDSSVMYGFWLKLI